MSYQKDTRYNLYFRPEAEAFGYSEGAEAEQRLLDIVERLHDRSTFSPEYLDNIVDWSTRYHFSRARHCLLRPLDIGPGDRVLELGCGTGAITRYLGETGAEVTAVEGSLARARVAAARCADLPNVTVIADDLQGAEVEGPYDWVTFIGVLEYAAAYSAAEDPYQSYLQAAMRHLEPGGKLVVAIENQLGLKYFNACGEDHLGKPFMGIQDLYQRNGGPRTFGRQALSRVLARAGLPQQQWLYPYPDYKVPSIVLSDAALAHPDFQAHDLLLRSDSEDYSDNRQRIFDEALVNRVLAQNGLLGDFSNSFLVVAQRPEQQAWQPAAMAWTFAAVHRHRGMATETRFVPQSGGSIRVTKRRILPHEPSTLPLADGHTISLNTQDSDYFPGQQMAWAALAAHVRDGNVPALVEALRPWCETLLFAAQVGASPLLPVEDEAAALAAAGVVTALLAAGVVLAAGGAGDLGLGTAQRGTDLVDLHLDDGALLALAGGVRALLEAPLRNDAHALGEGLGHVLGRLAPDRAAHEERLGVLPLIGLAVEDAGRRGDREGRDRRTRGGEAHLGVRGEVPDDRDNGVAGHASLRSVGAVRPRGAAAWCAGRSR